MKLRIFSTLGVSFAVVFGLSAISMSAQQKPAQKDDQSDEDAPLPHRWMGRLRGIDFVPANHSAPFTYLGGNFGPRAAHVGNKFGLEGDITYFAKPWLGFELGVSGIQSTFSLAGVGSLGSITQYPITMMAQYHLQIPNSPVKPYVGLGVAYVRFTAVDINAAGNQLDTTRDSFGVGYQLGVDVAIAGGFYVNLDFKHIEDVTNLKASGTILTDLNMTPNIFAIGVGYKF